MREPYDLFIKEFLQHPGWEYIIEKVDSLARDLAQTTFSGTKDDFDRNKGKVEGALEAKALLIGLIKQAKG